MIKLWPLSGGIHPPQNKHQTSSKPIGQLPLPERFYLSLYQDRGAQLGPLLKPIVEEGEVVKKGQLLATAVGLEAVPVHAPTSGSIGKLIERPLNHPSGNPALHLELISDGQDEWCNLEAIEEPFKLEKNNIINRIQQAGICGMGGAGFPTALKLSTENTLHTLILNGTECEPYITADDLLMQQEARDILSGALLCAKLLNAKNIHIAIEDNKPLAIASIQSAIKLIQLESPPGLSQQANFEIAVLPTIYPSGGTKQLVQMLTGQQVPSGQQASHLGLMVLNVATIRAIWRAIRWGEPLIERITTLTGDALSRQGNFLVRLGTPVEHVLNHLGWSTQNAPLILGGPLMGFNLTPQASLGKTSNCVIAPSLAEMPTPPAEAPCIRCGQCDSVCPALLLPQQLFWYAKAQDTQRLETYNLFDCIECGACSYVCPSNIPLVHYYRQAKNQIHQQQATKRKADQARARFEAHQTRKAQLDAEKQAKRLARLNAATNLNNENNPHIIQPSSATLAEQTPQDLAAKLQRHKISAQERLERLIIQEREEQDPNRKEKLAASIKQAQLRLNEALIKLSEIDTQQQNEKVVAKLHASPQQLANQALSTLQKQLAITEEKLRTAQESNLPSLHALTLAVEKLQQKIHQAQIELPEQPTLPSQPDAATLAAAEQALARLAAKKSQTAEQKHQALKESLHKRIEQLQIRIDSADTDKIPALEKSLRALEERLNELND